MAKDGKVIITCAVTGAIHTPTMSPYLPITPNEVAEDAIKAAEAGAWVCPFCKFSNENMTARRCVACDAPRLSAAELAEQREIVRS